MLAQAGLRSLSVLTAERRARGVWGPAVGRAQVPIPAVKGSTLAFRIARPEFVRLAITDAAGRRVRLVANAMMTPGEHALLWDGLGDDGRVAAPGLYFVVLGTSEGSRMQRLAAMR